MYIYMWGTVCKYVCIDVCSSSVALSSLKCHLRPLLSLICARNSQINTEIHTHSWKWTHKHYTILIYIMVYVHVCMCVWVWKIKQRHLFLAHFYAINLFSHSLRFSSLAKCLVCVVVFLLLFLLSLSTSLRNYCSYLFCNAQCICLKRSGESADSGRVVLEEFKKKTLSFHLLHSFEQRLKCFVVC